MNTRSDIAETYDKELMAGPADIPTDRLDEEWARHAARLIRSEIGVARVLTQVGRLEDARGRLNRLIDVLAGEIDGHAMATSLLSRAREAFGRAAFARHGLPWTEGVAHVAVNHPIGGRRGAAEVAAAMRTTAAFLESVATRPQALDAWELASARRLEGIFRGLLSDSEVALREATAKIAGDPDNWDLD